VTETDPSSKAVMWTECGVAIRSYGIADIKTLFVKVPVLSLRSTLLRCSWLAGGLFPAASLSPAACPPHRGQPSAKEPTF